MTKSKRYSNKIRKGHRPQAFFSLAWCRLWRHSAYAGIAPLLAAGCMLLTSCSTETKKFTYQRTELVHAVEQICSTEYKMNATVWERGDTVWAYLPLTKLLTPEGKFDQTASSSVRRLFTAIKRISQSMDTPPKFYTFVFADIITGLEIAYSGYIPDMIKTDTGAISLSQWQEREVLNYGANKQAIGDKEGKHVSPFSLTMEDFVTQLIRQKMEKNLLRAGAPDGAEPDNDFYVYHEKGKLVLILDVDESEAPQREETIAQELKKTTKQFWDIYKPAGITFVEVNNMRLQHTQNVPVQEFLPR